MKVFDELSSGMGFADLKQRGKRADEGRR